MPTDQDVNAQHLQDFIKELEKIRFDIRKSAILNKSGDKYIRNLERLIKTSKEIISGTASKNADKKFEKLVRDTDLSLRMLRKKNRKDEEFQDEFTKVFGDIKESQDASVTVFNKIHSSLKNMTSNIAIMSDASSKDVEDTGLSFFTGVLGAVAKETAGVDKVSDIGGKLTGMFGSDVKGQAHDGMTNIPSEGTYNLDGGERVLAPEQNKDLSSFLKNESGGVSATFLKNIEENTEVLASDKPMDVFNKDHNPAYFNAILDNDDRINIERENLEQRQHKEIKTKFEILGDIMSAVGGSFLTNFVLGINIWYKRFARHPILMTMGVLVGGMGKILKGISGFFGITKFFTGLWDSVFGTEAKSDTDRIVQANEDIISAIKGEAAADRRSMFTKIKDFALGKIKKKTDVLKEQVVTFGKSALKDMGGMFSKGLKSSKFGKIFSGMGKKFDKGFKNLNKQLPQKRDAKGRFAKRDKTEILIETMKRMSQGVFGILKINEDAADEAKKGKGGGGMLSKLFGGVKGFAKFGKRIVMMIGLGLMTGLKVVGMKVFAVLGTKMFGMLGLALAGGGLIGTYLINPLLNWIDSTFGTSIISMIGGLMTRIIAGLEELPGIGRLIKSFTGGAATKALKGGEDVAAKEKELAGNLNVAARVKSGELTKGSAETMALLAKIEAGEYEIKPITQKDGAVEATTKLFNEGMDKAGKFVKDMNLGQKKDQLVGDSTKLFNEGMDKANKLIENVNIGAKKDQAVEASTKLFNEGMDKASKMFNDVDVNAQKQQVMDKTQIVTQKIEKKMSEAAVMMKKQAAAVTNNVVNTTQQVIKTLPAVRDLETVAASFRG